MSNLFGRFKNFVNPQVDYDDEDEYLDDEYYDDVEYYDEPEPQTRSHFPIRNKKQTSLDKVVSISTNVNMQVVVSYPMSLEEASVACKHLQDRMVVVVNLEKTEETVSQRISDFLCGAGYALGCSIQSISNEIFIICPNNVSITGKFQKDLAANGIKIPNANMWSN